MEVWLLAGLRDAGNGMTRNTIPLVSFLRGQSPGFIQPHSPNLSHQQEKTPVAGYSNQRCAEEPLENDGGVGWWKSSVMFQEVKGQRLKWKVIRCKTPKFLDVTVLEKTFPFCLLSDLPLVGSYSNDSVPL